MPTKARSKSLPAVRAPRAALPYLARNLAPATQRAYASDLTAWQRDGGRLPLTPYRVAKCLATWCERLSVATLQRRLVALGREHAQRRLPSPAGHELVKRTMRGIRRAKGTRQRRVLALEKPLLLKLLAVARRQPPMRAARDSALLLVGFAGAFRRSELVALRADDVTWRDDGVELLVRRSKTDQKAAGRSVAIPRGHGATCPVRALRHWLAGAGIKDGNILRGVTRHGAVRREGLSPQSVATILKRLARQAGIDGTDIAGHSLRAGYVTAAVLGGVPTWAIKAQTGHRSDAVLARYIRPSVSPNTTQML